MEREVQPKDRNELKSVLISALASNGKLTDALSIYEEMKKADCPVEPKAIMSLIVSMYFSHMFFSSISRVIVN